MYLSFSPKPKKTNHNDLGKLEEKAQPLDNNVLNILANKQIKVEALMIMEDLLMFHYLCKMFENERKGNYSNLIFNSFLFENNISS